MVKESEVGSKEMKELDAGKSKRQKLNNECDVGDKGEISARGFTTPSPDCEHNRSSCSDTHPLDTSRYLSANRIVECAFCHSFRSTEVKRPSPLSCWSCGLCINSECIMH